jgi:cobalamin biosynthesis protein CobT
LGSQTDAGESGGQDSAESNAGKGGSASPAGPSADPASSQASSRTGDRNNASDESADPDADDQIANGGTFTGVADSAASSKNALAELDAEASGIMDDLGRMISDGVNSHAENAQVYRAWDKSRDRMAMADNSSARSHHERLAELLPQVAGVRQHLLQALQAEPKARWLGDREEGKIDPRSLHRLACPAPERENRPRVFRKKVRTKRLRTAATLLLDESTSMLELNRIELASQTALVFCEALARLNVKTSVIGFSTLHGDSAGEISRRSGIPIDELRRRYRLCPLIHTVYKRFDEKFSSVSGRFENMRPKNLTPLGESILFAARELRARPEERKVLFVLTDGMPFVGGHLAYAAFAHAREAVKRVEKAGVDVALVGIQEQAVRRLHHRSVVVNALDELPRTVMRQLRKLLAG